MNVPPSISDCCFAPLTVGGEGPTYWNVCSKCKKPANPKPRYWCAWCAEYGDHQSGWCDKLKGKIANAR